MNPVLTYVTLNSLMFNLNLTIACIAFIYWISGIFYALIFTSINNRRRWYISIVQENAGRVKSRK